MKIGLNIQKICKSKRLSLSQLSKRAGVPTTTLHAWTTGRKSINPDQIRKVATVLEVSLHELLFDEPDPFEAKPTEILKEIFSGDVRVTLHRIERRRQR